MTAAVLDRLAAPATGLPACDPPAVITWAERGQQRHGQIWGDAPQPQTVWAMPYEVAPWEDGHAAPVMLRACTDGTYAHHQAPDWRAALRCTETVRERGVYAVPASDGVPVAHCDTACPDAAGWEEWQRWQVDRWQVVDVLAGRAAGVPGLRLCGRCVLPEAGSEGTVPAAQDTTPAATETPAATPQPAHGATAEVPREVTPAEAPADPGDPARGTTRDTETREQRDARWVAEMAEAERLAGTGRQEDRDMGPVGIAGAARHAVYGAVRGAVTSTPAGDAATYGKPGADVALRTSGQPAVPGRQADPMDGVRALSLLARFHQRYDWWGAPQFADMLAAWDFQTHAVEDTGEPIWRAVARLLVAGMHGTGKDGTMAQIAAACGTSVLMRTTYAGIRDAIGLDKEVVILNEAQITFGAGKKSEDVRLIVNAHVKGNMIRDGRHGKLNVFGQVAMAGLPKLLTGRVSHEIEDTLSRCFVLWKERKPKGVHVPELSDAAEKQVRTELVPVMREWCLEHRDVLRARAAAFGAGLPTGLPDLGGGGRGNDQLARPLLAACDAATALARRAWREGQQAGDIAEDAEFPAEWEWSRRIRQAINFVSGVPEITEDEEGPLDRIEEEFDASEDLTYGSAAYAELFGADDAALEDLSHAG